MKKPLFNPEFFISETSGRNFRLGFIGSGGELRCRAKYIDVTLPEVGAVEALAIFRKPGERQGDQTGDEQGASPVVFDLVLRVDHDGAPVDVAFGTLTYVGSGELDDFAIDGLEGELTEAVQRAFFHAMQAVRCAVPVQEAEVRYAAPGYARYAVPTGPGQGWRGNLFSWRGAVGAVVVLVAVGLIGYGVMQSRKPKNPIEEALASSNFTDLQEKIREQIAGAAKGEGGFGVLQGQNVAIDTLKAMGLDPGKANSGCLVGVK